MGAATEDEVLERGYESLSDSDEEGRGLEYAFEGNSDIFDGMVDIDSLVAKSTDNDYQ